MCALALVAEIARPARAADPDASPPRPYTYPFFFAAYAGAGSAATPAGLGAGGTWELGHRPFGGALSTGFSTSWMSDVTGRWTVVTPGLLAKLDLTYIALSGFWSRTPKPTFPLRVHAGARVGVGFSWSSQNIAATATDAYQLSSTYMLVRPEMETFVDVERPLGVRRTWSVLLRGALDTPVTYDDLFRWSVSIGVSYAWGRPHE